MTDDLDEKSACRKLAAVYRQFPKKERACL